jgi:antibiotic biosynthesis monooxygenase (ABM) superfamily enzyme
MKSVVRFAFVAAFLLAITLPVVAQNPPSEFIQIITTTVRSTGVTEYEDYVKQIIAGLNTIGSPLRVVVYQVGVGGPSFTYNIVIPFNKWEDMDSWPSIPQILTTAYGDAEGARILKSGRDAIEHSESAVFRTLRNLSTRPRFNDPPAPLIMVVRTEIDPAMSVSYENYLSKLKAAQEKEPGNRTVNRSVAVLGTGTTYLAANFFSKHADRDNWTVVTDLMKKTYGDAEGQRLSEGSLRAVRKREIFIQSYRPDLSRLAPVPPR